MRVGFMTIQFDTSSSNTTTIALFTGLTIPFLAMSIIIGVFPYTIARIIQVHILDRQERSIEWATGQ